MSLIRRRMMMAMEMEDDEVKEWKLIAESEVESGETYIKIPVDNYREYLIFGYISAEASKILYVTANRENYNWVSHRIAQISNGVNSNASKRFLVKLEKIAESHIMTEVGVEFEGVLAKNEYIYMREIDSNSIGTIEYFWFSASDSSELTGGNIKIFAR